MEGDAGRRAGKHLGEDGRCQIQKRGSAGCGLTAVCGELIAVREHSDEHLSPGMSTAGCCLGPKEAVHQLKLCLV